MIRLEETIDVGLCLSIFGSYNSGYPNYYVDSLIEVGFITGMSWN